MSQSPSTILFLDKVLLRPRTEPVRGVELFNLNLLRDLAGRGHDITLPVHRSWAIQIQEHLGRPQGRVTIITTALGRSALANGLWGVLRVGSTRHDVLLLANIANSLIPTLALIHRRQLVSRSTLIAHREPSARFRNACRRLAPTVVAVNGKIASHFEGPDFPHVAVWYGITHADRFHPDAQAHDASQPYRFCVLGQLDNAWKGADTAVAAYRALPAAVQEHVELHLASFTKPPLYPEDNIVPYDWMAAAGVPEFLRFMDAMIVPSRDESVMRETFSQAIVQGMLTGLPVCAADLPILQEKLDQGGGSIFTTPEALANQMQALAEDPAAGRETGKTARRIALARYVWRTDAFATQFLEGDPPPVTA